MKYTVVGHGDVDLTSKNYLTQGGEGKIYLKNNTIYKIHENHNKMIPVDKIKELSVLQKINIIKPEDVLLSSGKPIGYTMKYVKDTFPLCQIFNKSYKQRNNISNQNITDLVKIMYDTINYIHSKEILIVDLNEMNFLVSDKIDDVYFIDVNSYQTKNFKATAIMDTIYDRHCNKKFTKETDWFSFGIVTFNMYIGIHPYKGKHATLKNLDERMKNNISVLNQDVSIPGVCFPFDVIPNALRKWYEYIFEKGERCQPPSDFDKANVAVQISKTVKTILGNEMVEITLMKEYDSDIIDYYQNSQGQEIVLTEKKIWFRGMPHEFNKKPTKIGFSSKNYSPVATFIDNRKTKFIDIIKQKEINLSLDCNGMMSCNDNVYIKNQKNVIEIQLKDVGDNIIASPKIVGNVMESSLIFDGIIIQSMLNENDTQTYFASIFPTTGSCIQFFLNELENYKIIDAKYMNQILILIGMNNKTKQYDKIVVKLSKDFQTKEIIKSKNIQTNEINFTVFNNGICLMINEDRNLEVFFNTLGNNKCKIVKHPVFQEDVRLFTDGYKLIISKNNQLFTMKMK